MPGRVLLAEDEPNIVEALRYLLKRAGFSVSVATTGPDALTQARETLPDVIVLDVMLPELDGFEILRQLRGDGATRNLRVLMLTAKGQREDRERAVQAGADLFVTKPFGNSELVDAVVSLAQSARQTGIAARE